MFRQVMEEVASYIGFGEADARLLALAGPHLRPSYERIVGGFYAAIERSPGALAVIESPAQVARLKSTLVEWLEEVFGGIYDEEYFARRARIGHVHVRIGLEQRYMFAAMNLLRVELREAIDASSIADKLPTQRALDRICDIELAIMLDSYREATAETLRRQERLATLGELAASIGHDLRNPLAVIETSFHLLGRRADGDERVTKHLDRISSQLAIANTIITDLLEMTRDEPATRMAVDVATLLAEAPDAVVAREFAEMIVRPPAGLPQALLDRAQVRQLLVNLVVNGMESVECNEAGGHVWLSADRRGTTLRIVVEDDGPGIDASVLPRVFEPLFTTRAKGIGLGLAICRRIVDKHGGTITAANRSEGGARFTVELPGAFEEAP